MKLFSKACIVLALFVLVGCGGGGNGGDSGGGESSSDGDTEQTETVMHNGVVTNVDAGAKKITVKVDGEEKEFSITDSTAVLGKQYQTMPFDSLGVDREVGVKVAKGSSTPMQITIVK